MGSLITALASYLDAKQRHGTWAVRIDNLDPPREDPHAITLIQQSLTAHGLVSDAPIDYQAEHQERYEAALAQLRSQIFWCRCSRRSLANEKAYPGTCRAFTSQRPDAAIRLHIEEGHVGFTDRLAGAVERDLTRQGGDMIIRRRDGLWAYNFATAVDDGHDFSSVVRGSDLFEVTAQQIHIMRQLKLDIPEYAHIPTLCFADGAKLSKQTHAPALDDRDAADNLRTAFRYLGLTPPSHARRSVAEWLTWGLEHFALANVPAQLAPYPRP